MSVHVDGRVVGVITAWRLLAAFLVVAMLGLFAVLLIQQRLRIRHQLRNRLTPLRLLVDQPAPIERRVRWSILGVVVVVVLAVMAFGGSERSPG